MGHNVDLGVFGMCSIRCKGCGRDLDLSEVDIDCDINTHNPMGFELNIQCTSEDCETKNEIRFSIKEEK